MNKYDDIFTDERARLYDLAMQEIAPHARDHEFLETLKYISPSKGDVILDYPSGGGYLQNYTEAQVLECDPSGWGGKKTIGDLEDCSVGYVLSVVGLHHYTPEQRSDLYSDFKRVLKPGGELVITEVIKGSSIDGFLNVFVNQYNSQGHDGIFLDDKEGDILRHVGFKATQHHNEYEWCFENEPQIYAYFKALFCLDLADDNDIAKAIDQYLERRGNSILWQSLSYHCELLP